MIIVSMLDRKVGFGSVGTCANEQIAKRDFGYAINNGGIPSYAPADFELYKLGEFDDKSGKISTLEVPELIATGQEMIGK